MRAVVQRVASASVTGALYDSGSRCETEHESVDNEVVSHISRGLMVLVGIGRGLSPTYSLSLPWLDCMSALTQSLFQYRRHPVRCNILVQENVRSEC